ncbi:DUF418 domain-containing protein [Brevundimonas sp. 2R-24]|uniref:DUF418 domain-containing protein n=1 Tax=Peiella sedimenti TaxID=3061083 RepID=A0ABT8SNI8_9CAUL|nr:DUF418 domain-containing protein [Caulobacteraceae bacterium XZ-24]
MTARAMAETAPDQPRPVEPKARIAALDVVRGLAILGILAVNAPTFALPFTAMMNPVASPQPFDAASQQAWWIGETFFRFKFISLFSMLFGVSIFLVGGDKTDEARNGVLQRRLLWLGVFGLLHATLFWFGDILLTYAIAGFLVMWARTWRPLPLIAAGLALYLVFFVLPMLATLALGLMPPEALAQIKSQMGWTVDPAATSATVDAYRTLEGSFFGNLRVLAMYWGSAWVMVPALGGLMMVGLGLFKTGFLAGRSHPIVYLLVIALAGVGLWLTAGESTRALEGGISFAEASGRPISAAFAPLIGLGYASVLFLLLKMGVGALLKPLSAAGRMAFTNYLTQTVIMTTLFYGGRGLGWFGSMSLAELWVVIGAVWLVQLVWSPLWLSRFYMGPLEWVWRRLSYKGPVPLLR